MTISRRIFISMPIIIYLKYKYPEIYAPLIVEALIFGFFGSIIHDYIIKFSFLKKQIEKC